LPFSLTIRYLPVGPMVLGLLIEFDATNLSRLRRYQLIVPMTLRFCSFFVLINWPLHIAHSPLTIRATHLSRLRRYQLIVPMTLRFCSFFVLINWPLHIAHSPLTIHATHLSHLRCLDSFLNLMLPTCRAYGASLLFVLRLNQLAIAYYPFAIDNSRYPPVAPTVLGLLFEFDATTHLSRLRRWLCLHQLSITTDSRLLTTDSFLSLTPQTLHRVNHCSFHCLKTYC
jgi:hypothetical protein